MSRPREAHVPTRAGWCDVHGETILRGHKAGRLRDGTDRIRHVCPPCHTIAVADRRRARGA